MSAEEHDDDGEPPHSTITVSKKCETSADAPIIIDASNTNDLMSRLSSFLPQIRAANIDLVNTQNQSILQIDQNLLTNEDDEEEEEEMDGDDTDDENDNDNCNVEEKDEVVHISLPNKRIKHNGATNPANTIVMDIHMNQDINHPLFQALADKPSEKDDNDDDDGTDEPEHNGIAASDTSLPILIFPHNVPKSTVVSKDGTSKLIEEIHD